MKVIRYSPDYHNLFHDFISLVPFLKNPDMTILQEAWALLDENEVPCAIISHELFDSHNAVLIRYFLFRQWLKFDELTLLFEPFYQHIKSCGYQAIYSLIENETLHELFLNLNFSFIDEKYFIINEISAHDYHVKVMALTV